MRSRSFSTTQISRILGGNLCITDLKGFEDRKLEGMTPPTLTERRLAEPEVLRCNSTADFLAALPQLTGFTATNSLFIVLFSGSRAHNAIRCDLTESEDPTDSAPLLDFLCEAVHRLGETPAADAAPAVVISSAQTFAECADIPWRRLAKRIERRLRRERIGVRELCCLAPDGWASYLAGNDRRHALSEISDSPIAANPVPDLSTLGEIPSPDPERLAKVAHWLGRIGPYDFPGAGPCSPSCTAPGRPSWFTETAAVTRALRQVDHELSPRMSAQLVRSPANPARWFVMAMGVLTRPEFPEEMADEMGAERFEQIVVDLGGDVDESPARESRAGWSMHRLLSSISIGFTEQERIGALRDRLLGTISETPDRLRPGLLAFSAWVWWLSGNQTVAQRHIREALGIEPANELARMVDPLVSAPLYTGCFERVAPAC